MGINMHIKDTWEVTMEEIVSMLPNSKAAKQVNSLITGIERLREENAYVNDMLENAHNRARLREAENILLREAMEKLARLGNGDIYGNSDGNVIAQDALRRCTIISSALTELIEKEGV